MNFEIAMTSETSREASNHLLQHIERGILQEDLCFALWRPSTGNTKKTAIVYSTILPQESDRELHGNASFQPKYMARALKIAMQEKAGLAFMHCHLSQGWQGMSNADIVAERDVLAYPAGATGFPLIGMTSGADGFWSARFWEKDKGRMTQYRCQKVRVVGTNSYGIYFDDELVPPPQRREALRRTFDTWGSEAQQKISRLNVGVVGLGSVGCIVAESLARIGVSKITLIDHDLVEEHNLDRLLYATASDIGKRKVDLVEVNIKCHATIDNVQVESLAMSIRDWAAYRAAVDCDILFSCVDRPVGRDALNYIAYAHLIPVVDGGIAVEPHNGKLHAAHWRSHIVGPGQQCMRCNGQYTSSEVVTELDGSLDDPSYIANLPKKDRDRNQNVFPFSLSLAGMEVNMMLHYLLAQKWWPEPQQLDYDFVTRKVRTLEGECFPSCEFPKRQAKGDLEVPYYLTEGPSTQAIAGKRAWLSALSRLHRFLMLRN